jgi:hypothetical protein
MVLMSGRLHARLSAPRTPADRLVPCDVDALILVLRLALLTGW